MNPWDVPPRLGGERAPVTGRAVERGDGLTPKLPGHRRAIIALRALFHRDAICRRVEAKSPGKDGEITGGRHWRGERA